MNKPDLDNHRENALRRALLFLRRGAMWRELPEDTEWFKVELSPIDLERVRFFPRAPMAADRRRQFLSHRHGRELAIEAAMKLRRMRSFRSSDQLNDPVREGLVNPTVLLIGVDARSPLTILDGNHRIAAAMLAQPPAELRELSVHLRLVALDDALLLVSHQHEYCVALSHESRCATSSTILSRTSGASRSLIPSAKA